MGLNASLPLPLYLVWATMAGSFGMVFICGVISLIITLTNVRKMIIESIPTALPGYFSGDRILAYVGIKNAGF